MVTETDPTANLADTACGPDCPQCELKATTKIGDEPPGHVRRSITEAQRRAALGWMAHGEQADAPQRTKPRRVRKSKPGASTDASDGQFLGPVEHDLFKGVADSLIITGHGLLIIALGAMIVVMARGVFDGPIRGLGIAMGFVVALAGLAYIVRGGRRRR